MLVKCPECGKEVSNKSEICIHCGCPLLPNEQNSICNINGIEYDLIPFLNDINLGVSWAVVTRNISDTCNISISAARDLYNILLNEKQIPSNFSCDTKQISPNSKPKCPTCSSQNLKKISTTSKVVNTAVFGLFGTKRHKTFHCNNCGYEW